MIPLGAFQKIFGARASIQLNVKPVDPDVVQEAMNDATVALRIERRLKPKQKDNFGMFTSDSILAIYHQATNGIFAVLVGVVALSLRRRRHRHHEHHADGGHRADLRDRPAQGARREAARHHAAGAGRVGHAVGRRRHRRHDARASSWRGSSRSVSPLPAAVQPWSVVLGIGITAVVGLVFGVYPAMRAARLDPIEALRKE